MKLISFISIFLILLSLNANSFVCDQGATQSKLGSWSNSKDEICIEAVCTDSEKVANRTKCIQLNSQYENVVAMTYKDVWSSPSSRTSHARAEWITIQKEDVCYDACLPKKEFFSESSGIKRKDCLNCFKARTDTQYDSSITYPEIGKKLLSGQKCYELCHDPKGPIVTERKLSNECQQCVGLNGHKAEVFNFLFSKSGHCLEIDQNNKTRLTQSELCQKADSLLETEYTIIEPEGFNIFNSPGQCLEVDSKTFGKIYKHHREFEMCKNESINNSDRNAEIDKNGTIEKVEEKKKSGTARQ